MISSINIEQIRMDYRGNAGIVQKLGIMSGGRLQKGKNLSDCEENDMLSNKRLRGWN